MKLSKMHNHISMNYHTLANQETIEAVVKALAERNFEAIIVKNGAEALKKIKEIIPEGASVMNGASRTLEQIGFIEYLKTGEHHWNNLHKSVLEENDPVKQKELRKHAVVSDFYLGSVHALAQTGELVIASNTGSQLPHLAFTSPNIILVVGTQKITSDLADSFERLDTYVIPLENENMQQKFGVNTLHSKTLILHRESPTQGRKIRVILVKEKLGF